MFIDKFGLSSDRSGIIYSYRLKVEGDYIYLRRLYLFTKISESILF